MQADLSQISLLVVDLLKDSPPELAARLKQRLNASLIKNGFDYFDEKAFGSKRFKDFLYKHFSETLTLVPPQGPGDILVSLKDKPLTDTVAAEPVRAEITSSIERPVVRSEVWQAFLNQDKDRRRFFSKIDGKVVHYRRGESADVVGAIEASPEGYAEITPISEELQLEWFRTFLQKHPPNPRIAESIHQLLEVEASGPMIDAISHMLGSTGDIWRAQRARFIYAHIAHWCVEHGLDPAIISSRPKSKLVQTDSSGSVAVASASARKQAHAILESLSDSDIAQIVLPILVSTVLVKARI